MRRSEARWRMRFDPEVMQRIRADQIRREERNYSATLSDTVARLVIEHLPQPTDDELERIRERFPEDFPKKSIKRPTPRKRPRGNDYLTQRKMIEERFISAFLALRKPGETFYINQHRGPLVA